MKKNHVIAPTRSFLTKNDQNRNKSAILHFCSAIIDVVENCLLVTDNKLEQDT